ncbi:NAD-dependent epimerase/dehydratase family protein [Streptomyces ovatisporus]|uniref:NAD-dependent epimerase/dehydratase family protein n=1 Tax=Streptomyces ovatisporus TaxID=1128682 RepID=A0ABV9A6C1_9ACTN
MLSGATGFIGSAVLGRLTATGADGVPSTAEPGQPPEAAPELTVRALTRRHVPLPAGVEQVRADLARPESLSGVCAGADVLVNAASHVGSDEQQCELINDLGTAALMREAARAGVKRIVHLSTTAVYGRGPHRGAAVGDLEPAPVSPASRTRLAGETHALQRGAVVLRAGLVTGEGDRWVVPALAELTRRVPGYWMGGSGRLSLVAVEDLARLVTGAVLRLPRTGGAVHHAVHPRPVRLRDLLETLASLNVLPPLSGELTWQECLSLLRANPGRIRERQLALLAQDHFYRGESLWEACRCDPGPGPLARLSGAAGWYRRQLRGA